MNAAHGQRARVLVAAAVALVSLVAIGIAWAGRVAEGRRALADADSALERGDATEAIFAARIAGEARCPGCTAPDEGFARLEKIARAAEARGDDTTAFAAWRATRAALAESDVPGAATFALIGLGGIVFLVAGARFVAAKAKRSLTELGLAVGGAAVAAAGALFF